MPDISVSIEPFRQTSYNLQFVFAGVVYQWQASQSFANGLTNMEINTGVTKRVHLIAQQIATTSTGMTLTLYEKGIKADGVIFGSIKGVNRVFSLPNTAIFYANPTTSTGGATAPVKLFSKKLIANTLSEQLSPEIILKSNTNYLMTMNNTSVLAVNNLTFYWYESKD